MSISLKVLVEAKVIGLISTESVHAELDFLESQIVIVGN